MTNRPWFHFDLYVVIKEVEMMSSTSYITLFAAIFHSLSFLCSIELVQLQYSFKAIVTYQVFLGGSTMTSHHHRDYFLF